MKRFLRRCAVVLAATTTCATLLPAAGAQATPILSPCDNVDGNPPDPITLDLGDLGIFEVQLQIVQDNYVKWTGGPAGDWLVGADLQTISLNEDIAVCVVTPLIGVAIIVNVVGLDVQICQIIPGPGTPPYTLDCSPL